MKLTTKRLIISNILVITIIAFTYVLSFNRDVEAAITSAYTHAVYKGNKSVKNSVGVMALVDDDIGDLSEIIETAKKEKVNISYMLSPKIIVKNQDEVAVLIENGYEIGIYGEKNSNVFEALSILNKHIKNDILYVQKMQEIDKDIFSNQVTVVVYSIDANIAYEKFSNDFGLYIEQGTFVVFEHGDEQITTHIFDAIRNGGFNIRCVGDML
jgi:hypothetical protein